MDSCKLPCVFSCYAQVVCPYYIAVIKVSHEYDYMLSPVSPSSESPNVRVALELLRHNIGDRKYLKV